MTEQILMHRQFKISRIALLALLIPISASAFYFPFSFWNSGIASKLAQSACTGGTQTTDGNFHVCTYTTTGSHTITFTSAGLLAKADILVVAGGGPGGGSTTNGTGGGGGGGAGEVVYQTGRPITATAYSVSVGPGSTGGNGTNGSASVFDTITASGGGWGATSNVSFGNGCPANAGGSGGGGAPNANTAGCATAGAGASINTGGGTSFVNAGGIDPFTGLLPGGGGGQARQIRLHRHHE